MALAKSGDGAGSESAELGECGARGRVKKGNWAWEAFPGFLSLRARDDAFIDVGSTSRSPSQWMSLKSRTHVHIDTLYPV